MSDTPEANAIPTPDAPPPAPADIVDALLKFAADKANNPLEQMAVSYAGQIVTKYKTELVGYLGIIQDGSPLSVKRVVDEVFAFAESKAQRLFVRYALKGLNVLIDDVGLPLLQAYLLSMGIPLPLGI